MYVLKWFYPGEDGQIHPALEGVQQRKLPVQGFFLPEGFNFERNSKKKKKVCILHVAVGQEQIPPLPSKYFHRVETKREESTSSSEV